MERPRCFQNHARCNGVYRHRSIRVFLPITKLHRRTRPLNGTKVGRIQRPGNSCRCQVGLPGLGASSLRVLLIHSGLRDYFPICFRCSCRQLGDGHLACRHISCHRVSIPKQAKESALVGGARSVGIHQLDVRHESRWNAPARRSGYFSVKALDIVIGELQRLGLRRNWDGFGADC